MRHSKNIAARILGVGGLALLLSTSVFAAPQDDYRSDRLSSRGRINSISIEGDRYRLTLDHGNYAYYVPAATMRNHDLRIGAEVRLGGIIAGDLVNVDVLAVPGEAYYASDPNYRPVPMDSRGWMSGVVQSVDRHLGYLVLRDEANGDVIKIDVRHMDLRHPVNVWGIRAGERISVNGEWERRGTFDAARIEY